MKAGDAGADRLDPSLLAELCLVSEVVVATDEPGPVAQGKERVTAAKSTYGKCERCWNYRPTVGQSADHPTLCERCARVVAALPTGS